MPEITAAEQREFIRYQMLGTPSDVEKKIHDLEADNKKQRDELRDAKELAPKDGYIVVSKADADKLTKYKALGSPDEIEGKLKQGGEAQTRLADVERRNAATKFVAAAGLAAEAVDTLVALPALSTATFLVKQEKAKNAQGVEVDANVAYISFTNEKNAVETLNFAQAQERFAALKGLRPAGTQQQSVSVPFVPQSGESRGTPGHTVFDKIREERKAAAEKRPDTVKSAEQRLGVTRAS